MMINIYYREGVELGIMYYLFSSQELGDEFHKFEFTSQLEAKLLELKLDVLRFNVEDFVLRFSEHSKIKNELEVTATNRMIDFLNWAWDNGDTPNKVYKSLAQMENFIVTIVNAYKGKDRHRAIKEWKLIMQFLEYELEKS